MQQLARLTPKHRLIAQYLVTNPRMKRGEVAAHFGMSQSYLSIITNSDAFVEYLNGLDEEIAAKVVIPLRDKLHGVAHRAIEKLGDAVEDSVDAKFLLDAADKTLHRLGFAPSRGPEVAVLGGGTTNIQNNTYVASQEDLERARKLMHHASQPSPTPIELEADNKKNALPSPETV